MQQFCVWILDAVERDLAQSLKAQGGGYGGFLIPEFLLRSSGVINILRDPKMFKKKKSVANVRTLENRTKTNCLFGASSILIK